MRMLGEGRPFILEIHNARRRVPPPQQLQHLEARVAEVGGWGGTILARGRGARAEPSPGSGQVGEGVGKCILPL